MKITLTEEQINNIVLTEQVINVLSESLNKSLDINALHSKIKKLFIIKFLKIN